MEENSRILAADVMNALKELNGQETFSCIFMDPPYQAGTEKEILTFLADSNLPEKNCVIIVEAALTTDFSWLDDLPYSNIKDKIYKTNRHLFLKIKENR